MHFSKRGVVQGIAASWPIGLAVFTYGIVFGILSRQAGLTLFDAMGMSALVFAGASQLVVLGLWGQALPVLTIVLTCFAVNLRYVLMGAALRPWLSRLTALKAYGTLFFMNDESWALTMGRFTKGYQDCGFFLGSCLVVYVSWLSSTFIGQTVITTLGDPARWGLDFALAAVFLSIMMGLGRGKKDVLPWAIAAVVSVASAKILPGKWHILLGSVLGSGVYALTRKVKDV